MTVDQIVLLAIGWVSVMTFMILISDDKFGLLLFRMMLFQAILGLSIGWIFF